MSFGKMNVGYSNYKILIYKGGSRMDKNHIKEALSKHSEIIVETVEHERITVKAIEDNDDSQYLHVTEPKDQQVEIDKITDVQVNNFNQL